MSLTNGARSMTGTEPGSQRVMNLSHFLRAAGRRLADAIGLVVGEESWTWRELDGRVDAMVCALKEAGIGKGDHILVHSKNCRQMFESMFVCFRLGAIWVPMNFRQTPADVLYIGRMCAARVMICHSDFPEHAAAARAGLETMSLLISIGDPFSGGGPSEVSYDALTVLHNGESVSASQVEYDDPCWFFLTSGTTGRPKAAMLTHGQMSFVINNHLCDLMPGLSADLDASLVVAPLSHGAGIHQLVQVARGVKTILLSKDGFDPAEAWALVEKWRVTNLFTVPTIVKTLVEHGSVAQYDHSTLRYVIYAGAPMYREDQKQALRVLGRVLVQYYGLGEVTGNITVLPPELHDPNDETNCRIGTCGYERTGMQVSIQDDVGRELTPNETGEICVAGPAVFAGYYNDASANAAAFRNGWFRTGDLGYQDEEGFLYITGRSSDMYISGGSNIYPREIEEKILTHPAIAEIAILGVPDDYWGEIGIGVAVLKADMTCSEAELLDWMRPKMARYKLPKRVVFWDEIPRTAYGKMSKKLIREALETRGYLAADSQ